MAIARNRKPESVHRLVLTLPSLICVTFYFKPSLVLKQLGKKTQSCCFFSLTKTCKNPIENMSSFTRQAATLLPSATFLRKLWLLQRLWLLLVSWSKPGVFLFFFSERRIYEIFRWKYRIHWIQILFRFFFYHWLFIVPNQSENESLVHHPSELEGTGRKTNSEKKKKKQSDLAIVTL